MAIELIEAWKDINTGRGDDSSSARACYAFYDPADHPVFDPLRWNKNRGANCYGYALQAEGECLNPGDVHGGKDKELNEIYAAACKGSASLTVDVLMEGVCRGLDLDGLLKADMDDIEAIYKPGHYLIALLSHELPGSSRLDYHFMVLNRNGQWSEIPAAGLHVNAIDMDDDVIKNPATAWLKPGMKLYGLYHAPRGGIKALRGERLGSGPANAFDVRTAAP